MPFLIYVIFTLSSHLRPLLCYYRFHGSAQRKHSKYGRQKCGQLGSKLKLVEEWRLRWWRRISAPAPSILIRVTGINHMTMVDTMKINSHKLILKNIIRIVFGVYILKMSHTSFSNETLFCCILLNFR